MSEVNFESRVEQAETNWQSVVQGHPGDNEWGFCSFGNVPGGISGGIGMIAWFPSRNEMLDFIPATLPYCPPGRGDLDWKTVVTQTAAIIEGMKSEPIKDEQGVERLNETLRTFSQIQWIGTIEDLFRGDHAYATKVRAAFRNGDESEDETAGAPLQPNEQEDFCNFLQDWSF